MSDSTAPRPLRETTLRIFVGLTLTITAWRMASTAAFLLAGPGLPASDHRLAETFFLLSKAFLGGLFWWISLPLEGLRDPLAWLLFPW